ncbi:MAG: OsmC family protein [Chitinophagales bacterium]|nr:OsmC family protein [Chitinophagales bacterium]
MTSQVFYEGDLRTTCTHLASNQSIITDAPLDNHGKGEAFSPTDLAATSLATCMLTVMGIYAQSRNIVIDGSYAHIQKIMANNPRRIAEIQVDIFINNNALSDKERMQLEQIGLNCPVAKSLHPDIMQQVNFSYPA